MATTNHSYDDSGTYEARLRASNARGLFSTVSRSVSVSNLPPTVSGVNDADGDLGVALDRQPPSAIPAAWTGSLVCDWDFGDAGPRR